MKSNGTTGTREMSGLERTLHILLGGVQLTGSSLPASRAFNAATKTEIAAAELAEGSASMAAETRALLKPGKCFFAGTPVATPDGWKPIEELKRGDLVYALDEITGERTERHITEVLRNRTYWWVDVKTAGETITATRTHRFWVAEQHGWKQAKDLRFGEHVRRLDGSLAKIESVRLWETAILLPTFNLEIERDHVFFVGKNGILVHNGDVEPHPLSPDSPRYPNPDRTESGKMDLDHRYSQTAFPEKAKDPTNLDLKPRVENRGPKAAWEKELIQWERELMEKTGWDLDYIRKNVTNGEWDSIAKSVHGTTSSATGVCLPR